MRSARRALLCAEQEDRHLDEVPDAVGGGAVEDIAEQPVPVRGHGDEIAALSLRRRGDLGRRVTGREQRLG